MRRYDTVLYFEQTNTSFVEKNEWEAPMETGSNLESPGSGYANPNPKWTYIL